MFRWTALTSPTTTATKSLLPFIANQRKGARVTVRLFCWVREWSESAVPKNFGTFPNRMESTRRGLRTLSLPASFAGGSRNAHEQREEQIEALGIKIGLADGIDRGFHGLANEFSCSHASQRLNVFFRAKPRLEATNRDCPTNTVPSVAGDTNRRRRAGR